MPEEIPLHRNINISGQSRWRSIKLIPNCEGFSTRKRLVVQLFQHPARDDYGRIKHRNLQHNLPKFLDMQLRRKRIQWFDESMEEKPNIRFQVVKKEFTTKLERLST
ncbi:hypothetical protein ACFFRR_005019 [Megaselia abdita]